MSENEKESPKSGSELISVFFRDLKETEDKILDSNVTGVLVQLYESGKLSNTNIANKLRELRESEANVTNQN